MKDRTLALAGIFQACELVRQAACHGTWSGFAATSSLQSLFKLDADSIVEIYGDTSRMRLGIETMLAVLQIEKKFRRSAALQDAVGQRLMEITFVGQDLEQHEREDLQAREISGLYSDTISGLSPRIVVNGKPQYLKNERTVDWVRALLLAGLRSATLWSQLGGGRFELMFGRKKIMREAESLLMG